MSHAYSRDELITRLVRAGELEVSGEHPEEVGDYFAPEFRFHGPGGLETEYAGLASYFESVRAAFESRTIRRGIMVVDDSTIACQTWIEGTFVNAFTQSPEGPIAPNGRRITFELINIFTTDDNGRLTAEYIQTDNRSLLEQLHAEPDA